jgi:hypothetical protein
MGGNSLRACISFRPALAFAPLLWKAMNEPLSLVLAPVVGQLSKGSLPPGLVLTAFLLSEVTGVPTGSSS